MYKILQKSHMPDNTPIQLEDWTSCNTSENDGFPDLYGLKIAVYPIAKRTGKYGIIQENEPFRLEIGYNPYKNYFNRDVFFDYEALKNGTKTLKDLSSYFYNGEKDMWYLGWDYVPDGSHKRILDDMY